MSKRLSFVGEGKTDLIVLQAIISSLPIGDDVILTQIQPPFDQLTNSNDQGELGGGWKGVLAWCRNNCEPILTSSIFPNTDILIVHVDADIASEAELADHGLLQPCPDANQTCVRIRKFLSSTLNVGDCDGRILYMIPSKSTEAWIIPAIFVCPPDIECMPDPARWLYGKNPRFVRLKGGAIKKLSPVYRDNLERISGNWPQVCACCVIASIFTKEVDAALAP